MNATEALAREQLWRENPQIRPQPKTAQAVATVLAERVRQLESQMALMQRLVVGRQVLVHRGNPGRGPETGSGFGRKIPAIIEEAPVGVLQIRCRLLVDDPDAVVSPCLAGESGLWSASQIVVD